MRTIKQFMKNLRTELHKVMEWKEDASMKEFWDSYEQAMNELENNFVQMTIDTAVEEIRDMEPDSRQQWLSYFFEQLETVGSDEILKNAKGILESRFEKQKKPL